MSTTPAIEIRALEKRYATFTLGPVDLTVPTGAIYGLIGPNSAGKTTLIDLIFGMGSPNAGTIKVCGFDHRWDEVAVKQRTAYVGPDLNFTSWGRVGKAIKFVSGFHPTWDESYCIRLLQTFGLGLKDRISTLSFGNRIKLSLILALSWCPQVLVLDEPTTGLDAHAKQAIFAELLAVVRDETRTVLISSHQLSDLERFADHVGILHRGRMLVEGPTTELLERCMQVEFTATGHDWAELSGLTIREHEGNRWRGMLDTLACPVSSLVAHGANDVRTGPLTLEELFITLTK